MFIVDAGVRQFEVEPRIASWEVFVKKPLDGSTEDRGKALPGKKNEEKQESTQNGLRK